MKYNLNWNLSVQGDIRSAIGDTKRMCSEIKDKKRSLDATLTEYEQCVDSIGETLKSISEDVTRTRNVLLKERARQESEKEKAESELVKAKNSLANVEAEKETKEREKQTEQSYLSQQESELSSLQDELSSIPSGCYRKVCRHDSEGNIYYESEWYDPYERLRAACRNKIGIVESKMNVTKSRIQLLSSQITKLQSDIVQLTKIIQGLQNRIENCKNKIEKINEMNDKGGSYLSSLSFAENNLPKREAIGKAAILSYCDSTIDTCFTATEDVGQFQDKGKRCIEEIDYATSHINTFGAKNIRMLSIENQTSSAHSFLGGVSSASTHFPVPSSSPLPSGREYKIICVQDTNVRVNYSNYNKELLFEEWKDYVKTNSKAILFIAPSKVNADWEEVLAYLASLGFFPLKTGDMYRFNLRNEVMFKHE